MSTNPEALSETAFPTATTNWHNGNIVSSGLTKREYFSAMAISHQAMPYGWGERAQWAHELAKSAIILADCLIEELNKPTEKKT